VSCLEAVVHLKVCVYFQSVKQNKYNQAKSDLVLHIHLCARKYRNQIYSVECNLQNG